MNLYYIRANDQIYGGLYGMEETEIVLCNDDNEAIDWAEDLSYRVMESYSDIYETLEERVAEICAEKRICYKDEGPMVEKIRDDVYRANLNYFIDRLDPNWLPSEDIDELEDLLWEIGDEEFIKRYSLKPVWREQ